MTSMKGLVHNDGKGMNLQEDHNLMSQFGSS
jgi:hypothetical protein